MNPNWYYDLPPNSARATLAGHSVTNIWQMRDRAQDLRNQARAKNWRSLMVLVQQGYICGPRTHQYVDFPIGV